MARAEARPARPLSPHLSIFRPYINMVMSIVHRITGSINYAGSLILALWLALAASGPGGEWGSYSVGPRMAPAG